jgi:hypothetical protein
MTSTFLSAKTLGQTLADASEICTITATGATGKIGMTLSVVQSAGVNRLYRVSVPSNATGSGVWKRLAPYDKTEPFPNQNHWAVDMQSADSVVTLRLVRTKAGSPASTTTLNCKVIAYASVGESLAIANSTATDTGATNAGIFEGAVVTQMDGLVGINTDSPSHILDVSGNVNTSNAYMIGGNTALTSSTLGPSITNSSLTTVGTLSTLNVAGNVALTGLSAATTGNVMYVDPSSGAVSYGALEMSGNLNVINLTASENVSATFLTGTLATAAQPNITTVGTLSTLTVTGNVAAGNVSGTTLSGTFLEGTLQTAAQPNITSVGTLSTLSVTGNVAAGNVSGTTLSGTNLVGTLQTAAQPNITTVGTLGSLAVSGNVSAGNVSATSLTGTLETAAQPSITSLGTLSSLAVTGNVAAGNVSGTTLSGTYLEGTLQTAAQPIITSVGTLSSLSVTGNVATGNLSGTTITGTYLEGTLQTAAQPNITTVGTLSSLNITGNVAAGNVSGTTLSGTFLQGTLQTASQPSITSVGTLDSLNVSGNVTAGNVSGTTLSGTFLQGTLQTASQPSITSVGTLSTLNVSGNVSVANLHSNQVVNTGTAYRIGNVDTLTATALGSSVVTSSLTSVGTLSSLAVTGNVAAGNLSTNAISATAISTTAFKLNGADWASSVIHATTTPFLYTGPGTASTNGVSFYSQTGTNGTAFVTAGGTSNSVFTFSTAGTYMLQAEVEVGFPWMPEGDINTYYLVNGNVATKFGNESHAPSNFSCTRPYLLTVSASDNVRFVIDSSSGNEYEVGLNNARLTMLKLA